MSKLTVGQCLNPENIGTLLEICLFFDRWSIYCVIGDFAYNESMPSKIQQNKLHKKNSLIDAAFDLFTSRDLKDISISDITTKAGVAKGTFYQFFKDKYDLRDYLITFESRKVLLKALNELEQNDFRNFEDAIVFMINQVLNQLITNPLLLKLIRRNLSFGTLHAQLNMLSEEESDLCSRFTAHARKCGIEYAQPKIVFTMIIELTGSICYDAIVENQPAPVEVVKPALFEAVRAILATAKRADFPLA